MVSHQPDKFGGHRHCGSGDITFLVVKEQDSICYRLNSPLLFFSKGHEEKTHCEIFLSEYFIISANSVVIFTLNSKETVMLS